MTPKIPWVVPTLGREELAEVTGCFDKGWYTQGDKVRQFERSMAELLEVPYALAVSSGSAALELTLRALGIGPGDEVIVPAMTFVATAAAVRWQHAVPVFVDIEDDTWNLDPQRIPEAVSDATKAVVFIDHGGNPADVDAISAVAERYGLIVVQDGAQSLGARRGRTPVGANATYATTSFHLAKLLTTVEGGMIFSRDEDFFRELLARRSQGEDPGAKYSYPLLGTNARMTDLAAGIGLAQIAKLEQNLRARRRVASWYHSAFACRSEIRLARPRAGCSVSHLNFPVVVEERDRIAAALRHKHGIDSRAVCPMPVYEQPLFRAGTEACRALACPVAARVAAGSLDLPIFPDMTEEQVNRVAGALIDELYASPAGPRS